MSFGSLSRRSLLGAAGAAAAATALPVVPALSPLLAKAAAADPQSSLEKLVDMRFGMFSHFSLGTFTDEEWAEPNQNPALFAPTAVDCAQWAAAAAAAKMSYGILTTKHHDGFALWPSAYGTQNVANSPYKQDVVKAYCDAFRAKGLRVAFYYSIWDRTFGVEAWENRHRVSGLEITDAIQPADMTFILGQITELLSNYGTIDMFITDGYAWQMGQQAAPYQRIRRHVKSLQPDIVMIDHGALSVPWLGDAIYFEEPLGVSAPAGNTYAATQGQTISNGWFWHPSTPTEGLMSKNAILSHLADLEPKYTSFILNCPPNRNGRLDTNIVNRLAEVGAAWSPDTSRPPLPAQPLRAEHPVTPVNAYATAFRTGEGPLHAIDGLSDKGYETCWSTWGLPTPLPHSITIDLGGVWSKVSTLEYLPKQWNRTGTTDGDITSYTISTSTDGTNFTQVATGTWAGDRAPKVAEWPARNAGFVRIQANAATGGYANMGGVHIGGRTAEPALVSRVLPGDGTVYRLVNRKSGKVVDVYDFGTADGARIQQWPWLDNTAQKWTFASTGDGYYEIKNVNSRKLMEVAGLSRADGGNVALYTDHDVPQQHWAVTPTGDGAYYLTNRFSGLALGVDAGSTADGADIEQFTYRRLAEQQWQIIAL
ncbi:RICIN domain-containing protein [Streptomyces scabiei]|uniref:RICIN domain-containing protein n=2 Tax=Streptomyces scabiei TaxID=1930 RepID=UPI001B316478|nr:MULTISPECIES: RICIN domain-containing protein [Streptomyces]MBP5859346.1 alpha-L-fucosidase [Streptomyces sp. LBUM 1484]MBP5880513.1 alpha-L-fucosidase [Streptomyces sp. LBUM 1477]MBP5888347.1 alpha-L-fucosidase [Streptomyces sp. LBUM 1487]MBP5904371.1 alpha-L-fucosidase [Streptomyces sp. LBUM 1488]MDW8478039.1 RICIN domain-containing protein [Streptomyces scabiei]